MAVQLVILCAVSKDMRPVHLFVEEGGPQRVYCNPAIRVHSGSRKSFCVWDDLVFQCPTCQHKFNLIRRFWENARKTGGTNGNEA